MGIVPIYRPCVKNTRCASPGAFTNLGRQHSVMSERPVPALRSMRKGRTWSRDGCADEVRVASHASEFVKLGVSGEFEERGQTAIANDRRMQHGSVELGNQALRSSTLSVRPARLDRKGDRS